MFSKSKLSTYITPVSITRSVEEEKEEEGGRGMNRLSWRRFERLKVSVALCAPTACKCNRPHLPSQEEGEGRRGKGDREEK